MLDVLTSHWRLKAGTPYPLIYVLNRSLSWLEWFSGLSAGLQIERSPFQFLVQAQARVVGRVPGWGCAGGN